MIPKIAACFLRALAQCSAHYWEKISKCLVVMTTRVLFTCDVEKERKWGSLETVVPQQLLTKGISNFSKKMLSRACFKLRAKKVKIQSGGWQFQDKFPLIVYLSVSKANSWHLVTYRYFKISQMIQCVLNWLNSFAKLYMTSLTWTLIGINRLWATELLALLIKERFDNSNCKRIGFCDLYS